MSCFQNRQGLVCVFFKYWLLLNLKKCTLIILFKLMPVSKTDTTEFYSLRIESMLCMQIKHGCKEEDNNYDGLALARKTLLLLVRGFLCK